MNSQTEKNQLPKKHRASILLTAAASAIALVLIAVPLLGSPADAALDTGKFCIQASSAEGEFTGKGGACNPGVTPEDPDDAVSLLPHRQGVSFTIQDASYANAVYTLRYKYGNDAYTVHSGTASKSGYLTHSLITDRNLRPSEPQEARSMTIILETSKGNHSWELPADRFPVVVGSPKQDENGDYILDENGDPVLNKPYYGGYVDRAYAGSMIFFVDGAWRAPNIPNA